MEEIFKDAERRMDKTLEALKSDLSKLRTGRAHPSLIDHLQVSYYGTDTPLNQVAAVAIEDARTLTVTPWDKNAVSDVEKAIMSSDLGLNPATAGTVIRVPLPPLTEERRKDMAKQVRAEGENAKIAIRNIRRDANSTIKDSLKAKDISEDEARQGEDRMQKLTDQHIADIDKMLGVKEKELMEV